jgi:hypothetical protein
LLGILRKSSDLCAAGPSMEREQVNHKRKGTKMEKVLRITFEHRDPANS